MTIGEHNVLYASQEGIVQSGQDQSVKVRSWLSHATGEHWKAVLDVEDVDCAGADIWASPTGDHTFHDDNGYHLQIAGVMGRFCSLNNINLTVGKMYRSGPSYNISIGALVRPSISNIHMTGAIRFLNAEVGLHLDRFQVFASTLPNFYAPSNLPASWGADPDSDYVIEQPYPDYQALMELIHCNHIVWDNCTIQNGADIIVNGSPAPLVGVHASQSSGKFTGGQMSNNSIGYVSRGHPVYGSAASQALIIERTHFEGNLEEDILLDSMQFAKLNGHHRKSVSYWDHAKHPIIEVSNSALNRSISIDGYFQSDDPALGLAVKVKRCDGLQKNGYFKNIGKAFKLWGQVTNASMGMMIVDGGQP